MVIRTKRPDLPYSDVTPKAAYLNRRRFLATALAAVDEGLELTLLDDAVGAGPEEGVMEAARSLLRPFVRIRSSSTLLVQELEEMG